MWCTADISKVVAGWHHYALLTMATGVPDATCPPLAASDATMVRASTHNMLKRDDDRIRNNHVQLLAADVTAGFLWVHNPHVAVYPCFQNQPPGLRHKPKKRPATTTAESLHAKVPTAA